MPAFETQGLALQVGVDSLTIFCCANVVGGTGQEEATRNSEGDTACLVSLSYRAIGSRNRV